VGGDQRRTAPLAARAGAIDAHLPLGDLVWGEAIEDRLPGQRRAVCAVQAQPCPADALDEICPRPRDRQHIKRAGVATVSDHHLACCESRTPEAFRAAAVGQVQFGEAPPTGS